MEIRNELRTVMGERVRAETIQGDVAPSIYLIVEIPAHGETPRIQTAVRMLRSEVKALAAMLNGIVAGL
jgi:hypothetical protein